MQLEFKKLDATEWLDYFIIQVCLYMATVRLILILSKSNITVTNLISVGNWWLRMKLPTLSKGNSHCLRLGGYC